GRRVGRGPRSDVGDHGERVRAVDPVDPGDVAPADIWPDERDERVGGAADERDVHHAAEADRRVLLREPAPERPHGARPRGDPPGAPGPCGGSATYGWWRGPTVLPTPPARPPASSVGAWVFGWCALAAVGATLATNTATNSASTAIGGLTVLLPSGLRQEDP